jgi:hypothetical protein
VQSLSSAPSSTPALPLGGRASDSPGLVLLGIAIACVVAGGLVAAVTGPLDLAHGSWLAAYLVLVGGVGQGAMGAARLVAPGPPHARTRGRAQILAWNLGNALVVTGTLTTAPLVVDAGGLACVVALTLALLHSRRLRSTLTSWAYRAVLAVLLVSVPVGLVLAHLRATS